MTIVTPLFPNLANQNRKHAILVVDNDQGIRDAIIEILDDYGYQAIGVGNGHEALIRLQSGDIRPALILLDMTMPVMSGEQFYAARQDDPQLKAIPIVVISASTTAQATASQLEVDGFIAKPIDVFALLGMVAQHCKSTR